MNFKSLLFYFYLFTFTFSLVSAQQHKVDSLLRVLDNTKEDTARLRVYLAIGDACDVKDNLKYAEPAIQLCEKLLSQTGDEKKRIPILKMELAAFNLSTTYYSNTKDTSGKAIESFEKQFDIYKELKDTTTLITFIVQGSYYLGRMGNFPKAIYYCQKGMEMAKEMNYKTGISLCLFRMAELYGDQDENDLALQNLQKCIVIDSLVKDPNHDDLKRDYLKIGNIYSYQHDTSKALNYFHKALAITDTSKERYAFDLFIDLGRMYRENNDLPKAIRFYQMILNMGARAKNDLWMAVGFNSLGNVNSIMGMVEKSKDEISKSDSLLKQAIDYYNKGLKINEELSKSGKNNTVLGSYFGLAKTYFNVKDYKQAKYYTDKYIQFNPPLDIMEPIMLLAAQIDSASGNYSEAYAYYQKYISIKDNLKSAAVRKAALQDKFKNEYEKEQAEQAKKDAEAEAEKKKQRIISSSIAGGLILALIFGGFVVRSLRITRKQKGVIEVKSKELEEKNKDILDSIHYAQRIQKALLASDNLLKQNLPEYFVLFKPKDIVSGDFYWATKHNNRFYLAVCDSTGHGVPGAFMSLLNISYLNEAISERNIVQPNEVFNHARKRLIDNVSQDGQQDGMDGILFCLEVGKESMFAAAHNPPIIVRSGQVMELPADKIPVGKSPLDSTPFTHHSVKVEKGDTLYLFTDGYADQFGGPKGKKFKYKQLQELLMVNCELSMNEQKQKLEETLNSWKGSLEQVDDILIIGIRV